MDVCSSTVFTELEGEWERLVASGRLDRALTRWRDEDERLAAFADLGQLTGLLADRSADPDRQSEVLLALLCRAPADPLAARLVLQRFEAPLRTMAAWDQPWPLVDWAAQVVSAAFEVIVTYPVQRRPLRVAANIVWDVRKRLYATLAEHRRWHGDLSEGCPDATIPDSEDIGGVEAAQMLRWAAQETGLQPEAARLIVLTRVVGFGVEEVAARAGVPSARLRQRRCRSERRLRAALAVAG